MLPRESGKHRIGDWRWVLKNEFPHSVEVGIRCSEDIQAE